MSLSLSIPLPKIVVFDLDETLGYFFQFSIFWESLRSFIKKQKINYTLSQDDFNTILDLYPEFIRPNLITILNYLKHKKMNNECKSIFIYTNNQGPKIWIEYIKTYFEQKINYKLFNQVVCAFKINGKQIEICRTTHEKTINDLIKCCKLPLQTQICFIDDTYYSEMKHDNVVYIKINPYIYNLPFDVMIQRFINSQYFNSLLYNTSLFQIYFEKYIHVFMKHTHYIFVEKAKREYEIDKIVTKKMMLYLQDFFYSVQTDKPAK